MQRRAARGSPPRLGRAGLEGAVGAAAEPGRRAEAFQLEGGCGGLGGRGLSHRETSDACLRGGASHSVRLSMIRYDRVLLHKVLVIKLNVKPPRIFRK